MTDQTVSAVDKAAQLGTDKPPWRETERPEAPCKGCGQLISYHFGSGRWNHVNTEHAAKCPGPKIPCTTRKWVCNACGFHPDNLPNWCALGCGNDYNRMIEIPS